MLRNFDKFEVGHYYVYTGGKEEGNWNPYGAMDFAIKHEILQCSNNFKHNHASADFKGYESVLPGSADRILKMSENQSSHRQTIEKAVVLSEVENSKRGQRYAFVITLVALVFGFILLLFDKKLEGFVTLISTAVGLVGIFVYTKESEKEERKEKSKDE